MKTPGKMRKATREALLAALDEAFAKAGMPIDSEFTTIALQILRRSPAPPEDLNTIMIGAVRAAIERSLDDAKEPTPDGLKQALEYVKMIPYQIRKDAKEKFHAMIGQLPHPPGGRRRKLTEAQKVEVRSKIGQLDAHGCERADAYRRVAAEYGVSVRTVQRAWSERKSKRAGKVNSVS